MNLLISRLFLFIFCLPIIGFGQSFSEQLDQSYENYKEPSIQNRRFKHQDILPLIKRLETPFIVSKAGESLEGRAIYQIKIGTGATKVLLLDIGYLMLNV